MVLFNFQRHGILLGEGSERVYRAIGDFLDHIRKQPRPAPAPETESLPQTEESN